MLKNKLKIKEPREFFKRYCEVSFILDIVLIIFATLYLLGINFSLIGQILGYLFFFVFFSNLGLIILSDKYLIKSRFGRFGKKINRLTYAYLFFLICGMFVFLFVKIFFFIIFGFSLIMAYLHYLLLKMDESETEYHSSGKKIQIIKILIILFCVFFYFMSFLIAWKLLTPGPPLIGAILEVVSTLISGTFLLCVPIVTILLVKLIPKRNHRKIYSGVLILGISFTIIFSFPLFSTPVMVYDANMQFEKHYGPNWNDFDENIQEFFMDTPFVLGHYYFGVPPIITENVEVIPDLLFAKGEDYELRYDVYYSTGDDLIGDNSTLINIHGGGFMHGDKGGETKSLKYFASQGYIVFDIQYRIIDVNFLELYSGLKNLPQLPRDEDLVGNWTLYDIISDIEDFTYYLYNNKSHGANLQKVFFTGGSAGAYLAAIAALGYNEIDYKFCPELNVLGAILISAPNYVAQYMSEYEIMKEVGFIPGDTTLEEDPELYDRVTPSKLADKDDPPVLMFHGTVDVLAPYSHGQAIQESLLENNVKCILVKEFFGGHGAQQGVNYATVAQYYFERFLYLVKVG